MTLVVLVALASGCTQAGGEGSPVDPSHTDTLAEETGKTETMPPPASESSGGKRFVVARVVDGDTIELRNGQSVRLLQIDAPEPKEGECYARTSTGVLRSLLPQGTKVVLKIDQKLDRRDRYGRLLRYVFLDDANVNLELVTRGAASVWFFRGERGRYAKQLLRAAMNAKANARGLWQACRGTVLDPSRALVATSELPADEVAPVPASASPGNAGDCDPSYPTVCIAHGF